MGKACGISRERVCLSNGRELEVYYSCSRNYEFQQVTTVIGKIIITNLDSLCLASSGII